MGNTLTLHKTALIEAFNLKAAIEYLLKNQDAAREALTDMPPRFEMMMMMMMTMIMMMNSGEADRAAQHRAGHHAAVQDRPHQAALPG